MKPIIQATHVNLTTKRHLNTPMGRAMANAAIKKVAGKAEGNLEGQVVWNGQGFHVRRFWVNGRSVS